MFVSSAMATRDRSSESARFEVLNSEYRYVYWWLLFFSISWEFNAMQLRCPYVV